MKNISKILAAATAILFSAAATEASAQATATASATATIVTPIDISKTADMDFGNVAVHASTGGTVVLAPAGTRTSTSGVTLPATAGTVTAAAFTVSGQASYTYAITLPTGTTQIEDANSNTMDITLFTSSPATTGVLSSGGTQALTVGATLTVVGGQAAGVYTTGSDFSVTVNYN